MADRWIYADQVFDGARLRRNMALHISADHRISDITPAITTPDTAQRLQGVVTPGFVDLQVNGSAGVLVNQTPTATALQQIVQAQHRLGTVAIMPTVITDAPDVMARAAAAVIAAKDTPGIAGLHIEGPHIAPERRGTHAADFIRPLDDTTMAIVRNLRAAGITTMITLAPEAATLAQISTLVQMGAIVSLGHSNCSAADAAAAFAAGAGCVTHLFNAMSGPAARAPGLAGAAINSAAYIGMICDGVHVADQMIALALRARPVKDRSFLVSDAMPTAGGPAHFTLYGQRIYLENNRLINAEGHLAGAHTTLAAGVARLTRDIGLSVETALRMALTVPAKLIKAPQLAQITGRNISDLIVLDDDLALVGSLGSVIDKHM